MDINELTKYGASDNIVRLLKESGIKELTDIQEQSVVMGLFSGINQLISAPSTSGKTLIGELAAINAAEHNKNALFLVPLKALAEEKYNTFKERYETYGVRVAISTRDRTEFDNNLYDYNLVVSIYEKIEAILRTNIDFISNLDVIVIDEIQYIDEPKRGPNIEVIIAKIRQIKPKIQIIGLSAVLARPDLISDWFGQDTELISTNIRPIQLKEGVYYNGEIMFREYNDGKEYIIRVGKMDSSNRKRVALNLIRYYLQNEEEGQILVYCSQRNYAEDMALELSQSLTMFTNLNPEIREEIRRNVEATQLTGKLMRCLERGVAFHHAALWYEEQRYIEQAFYNGGIKVIFATPTLAAGINLPARTVIFHVPKKGREDLTVADYKNISGRAGRLRFSDPFGRSILIATSDREFKAYFDTYVKGMPDVVLSKIMQSSLASFTLGFLTTDKWNTSDKIFNCLKDTYFGSLVKSPAEVAGLKKELEDSFGYLLSNHLISKSLDGTYYELTNMGKRAAFCCIQAETAVILKNALDILQNEMIEGEDKLALSLIYLTTLTPDVELFRLSYKVKYDRGLKRKCGLFQVENQGIFIFAPRELEQIFCTMLCQEWISGKEYNEIFREFGIGQGIMQEIADYVSWVLHSLYLLSDSIDYNFEDEFKELILNLSDRVKYGVRNEAVYIARLNIPGVKRRVARQLIEKGINNEEALFSIDIGELSRIVGRERAEIIKSTLIEKVHEKIKRYREIHILRASNISKDPSIIASAYDSHGNELERIIGDLLDELEIRSDYIGDTDPHNPDYSFEINNEVFVVEVKGKIENKISSIESEEILGKGARYNPEHYITIGNPDFVDVAIQNTKATHITLIPITSLIELLLLKWEESISQDDIYKIFSYKKYVSPGIIQKIIENEIIIE